MNRWQPRCEQLRVSTWRTRTCDNTTVAMLLKSTLASVSSKTLFQNLLWEDIYIKLNLEPYCGWLYMSPVHLSLTVRVCLKYKTNVSIFEKYIFIQKSLLCFILQIVPGSFSLWYSEMKEWAGKNISAQGHCHHQDLSNSLFSVAIKRIGISRYIILEVWGP